MGEAFFVMYKNLRAFSVGSYISIDWKWDKKYIQPLSSALYRKTIEVNRRQTSLDDLQLATIHFDGSIEPRNLNGKNTFKGKLFYAHAGDVVYSKIDVRNGAIGIIPTDMPEVAVSSEYPVYSVDTAITDASYIHLVFRTSAFQRILNSMISGASGRKRVQPGQIEAVEIPLPPLEVQHAIVAHWQVAQKSAQEAEKQVKQIEADAESKFLADLGTKQLQTVERLKSFVVDYSQLEQWGVRQVTDQLLGLNHLPETKFPVALLGNYATVSYGIQKSPANRPGQHARPYLRVANVRKGYLDLTEIKEINVPDAELDYYRLEPGDILFVEGNGSRAELGRVGMWNGEIENCVHQNHLIKVRVNPEKLDPEYVMTWFNTELGRGHFFRSAKTSSGLGTINSREVREAPIPVPPLQVQQSMLERVHAFRAEIAHQRERVIQIRREAEAEVEAMLLGTKAVPNR
jgi:type I restriction enzyme S subunit